MDTPVKYETDLHLLVQQIELNNASQYQNIVQKLSIVINYFILHDFQRLVQLLYTIDVDERKLKQALQQQEKDAAIVIAEMILQRQIQKLITRQEMKNLSSNISDDEKW